MELRYGFGKNWEQFVKRHFDPERVEISKKYMLDFLKMDNLQGKYFLDIGCGSGLHSLAALQAGAARIISFDLDPNSVKTALTLKEYAGNPPHWAVLQGSILDDTFISQIEPADIAYSWGVLHHTGALWKAFKNAAGLMKASGVFYVALYTESYMEGMPKEYWLSVKQNYNRASSFGKKVIEVQHVWRFFLYKRIRNIPRLVKQAREYKALRGMELYTNIKDWLGGWPMEYSSPEEVVDHAHDLGLELINFKSGEANLEYIFCRNKPGLPIHLFGRKRNCDLLRGDDNNYLVSRISGFEASQIIPLKGPFYREEGFAWQALLPEYASTADDMDHSYRSKLILLDDGKPLWSWHTPHDRIRKVGKGCYSHWQTGLMFSTTDNSDPNTNGRTYQIVFAESAD